MIWLEMVVSILRALRHGLDQRQIGIKLLHDFLRGRQNGERRAFHAQFDVHLTDVRESARTCTRPWGLGVSSMLRYL